MTELPEHVEPTVHDPEAAELLARKREAADAMLPRLNQRVAEAHAAAAPEDAPPLGTGTIMRYEAFHLPRGYVVVELPSRSVEADFESMEQARVHAHQLNEWLARRPPPDMRYRMFVPPPEPTEAALIEMIDRVFDREQAERRAMEPVRALVAELRPVARKADREAREARRKAVDDARKKRAEGEPPASGSA